MANNHRLGRGRVKHAVARPNNSRSSPAQARQQLLRHEALTWRSRGLTFAEIGQKMGISYQKAADLTYAILTEPVPFDVVDRVRKEEEHRLQILMRTYVLLAEAGDVAATNVVLKASKQRAELYGVARPANAPATIDSNLPNAELLGISVEFVPPPVRPEQDSPPGR